MKADVLVLTDSRFEGRETGQLGAYAAGEWLQSRMAALGLKAAGDSGFYQTFRYKPHPPMQVHGDTLKTMGMAVVGEVVGKNVIGATVLFKTRRSAGALWVAITITWVGATRTAFGAGLPKATLPCTPAPMTTPVVWPFCWNWLLVMRRLLWWITPFSWPASVERKRGCGAPTTSPDEPTVGDWRIMWTG